MDKNSQQQLADRLHELIREKQIRMRPRAYFVVSAVLFGAGLSLTIALAILYIGTIVFRLRIHAPFLFLQAGRSGWSVFFATFPWLPFLCAGIAIVASIMIMRRYDFSYRHAFPAILIGFCGVLIVLGITADILNLPSQANRIGIVQTITGTDYDTDTWIVGSVASLTDHDFTLQTPQGATYVVTQKSTTSRIPPDPVKQGEWAQVLGERDDGDFMADSIIHRPMPHGIPPIQQMQNSLDD
jgi:hypothetical protein